MLSQDYLNRILSYNQETGKLVWRTRTSDQFKDTTSKTSEQLCNWWNSTRAGREAGYIGDEGYWLIGIDEKYYKAHRIIWIIMKGKISSDEEIDHKNGIRHDNRWLNLRKCSRPQSRQNLKTYKSNTSGYPGIYICKDGRNKPYRPYISVDGKKIFKDEKGILKSCETLEEAIRRRDEAKAFYHTFCPYQRDDNIGIEEREEKMFNSNRSHKQNNLPIGIYRIKYGRMQDYKYRVAVPGSGHNQQWLGYFDTLEEGIKAQHEFINGERKIERKEKDLPIGITRSKDKFKATIYENNQQKHLGYFDSLEEAIKAQQNH